MLYADLISRMNLTEKISQIGTSAGAVARLTIPAYEWYTEAKLYLTMGYSYSDSLYGS